MAKFVKLENGKYINIESIITIDEKLGRTYRAHTLGFDDEWMAHDEILTESDLSNILKATRKEN